LIHGSASDKGSLREFAKRAQVGFETTTGGSMNVNPIAAAMLAIGVLLLGGGSALFIAHKRVLGIVIAVLGIVFFALPFVVTFLLVHSQ
jgi:hypothetical protein